MSERRRRGRRGKSVMVGVGGARGAFCAMGRRVDGGCRKKVPEGALVGHGPRRGMGWGC